jgi:hypothetical protein
LVGSVVEPAVVGNGLNWGTQIPNCTEFPAWPSN